VPWAVVSLKRPSRPGSGTAVGSKPWNVLRSASWQLVLPPAPGHDGMRAVRSTAGLCAGWLLRQIV